MMAHLAYGTMHSLIEKGQTSGQMSKALSVHWPLRRNDVGEFYPVNEFQCPFTQCNANGSSIPNLKNVIQLLLVLLQ
jgi:hypothetical protein